MKFSLDHIFAACGMIPVKPKKGMKFKYERNPMYEPPDGVKIAIVNEVGEPFTIKIIIDPRELK